MQKFCENCAHRKVPLSIKNKFNTNLKFFFVDCPCQFEDIYGCTTKYIVIDWNSFLKWLIDNELIEEIEIKTMEAIGLYESAK